MNWFTRTLSSSTGGGGSTELSVVETEVGVGRKTLCSAFLGLELHLRHSAPTSRNATSSKGGGHHQSQFFGMSKSRELTIKIEWIALRELCPPPPEEVGFFEVRKKGRRWILPSICLPQI